jgi:hypothetical protein
LCLLVCLTLLLIFELDLLFHHNYRAAYLLSCLSAHSFWLNFKNEPEKDFKYFLEAHVGETSLISSITNENDGDLNNNDTLRIDHV